MPSPAAVWRGRLGRSYSPGAHGSSGVQDSSFKEDWQCGQVATSLRLASAVHAVRLQRTVQARQACREVPATVQADGALRELHDRHKELKARHAAAVAAAWRLPGKEAASLRSLVEARFDAATRELLSAHERLGTTEQDNARMLNTR